MSEITEGFDSCFEEIGLGYDEMTAINDIAEKVSSALYELHEVMQENDLYEKYPMQDKFGGEGTVFNEYDRKLYENMQEAVTRELSSGHNYAYVGNIGGNLAESSLKAATEVLQETIGKEYGIEFSYQDRYNEGKLMINGYDYQSGYINDNVNEILEKQKQQKQEQER